MPTPPRISIPPYEAPRPRPQSAFLSIPGLEDINEYRPSSHRRVVLTGDLPALQAFSTSQKPPSHSRNASIPLLSRDETQTHMQFQLIDPKSAEKREISLPIMDNDIDHDRLPGLRQKGAGRDRAQGALRLGCCGICDLGTVKFVGGKIMAWLTGTMLPIAFRVVGECLGRGFH